MRGADVRPALRASFRVGIAGAAVWLIGIFGKSSSPTFVAVDGSSIVAFAAVSVVETRGRQPLRQRRLVIQLLRFSLATPWASGARVTGTAVAAAAFAGREQ